MPLLLRLEGVVVAPTYRSHQARQPFPEKREAVDHGVIDDLVVRFVLVVNDVVPHTAEFLEIWD